MRRARLRGLGAGAWPVVTALAAAVLVLDLLAWGYGEAPLATLGRAFAGTWGTPYGIGQVLFKATPLVFAGASVAFALRAGLFNIGAEGQIALASLAAALVGASLPAHTPAAVALPCVCLVATVVGGAYGAVPGVLRARFGAHEVIATLMLNRIASAIVSWSLAHGAALHGTVRTADVVAGARLTSLGTWLPAWRGSAVSLALPLAVGVCFAAFAWGRSSRAGREIAWVGLGARASAAQGVPVARRLVQAMAGAGALAGLAATSTVLGYKGYYEAGLGAGAGFAGIAVALLGRGHALGIVLAALLFGTLDQAGLSINARVPREAMDVLQAVVILVVALADVAARDAARREATT